MTSFTNFYKVLYFSHFQGAFIIFLSFLMCFHYNFWHFNDLFSKKKSFKVFNNYLMLNLTHGYDMETLILVYYLLRCNHMEGYDLT